MLNGLIADGYYSESGRPTKCTECESVIIKDKVVDSIKGQPCEKNIFCGSCNAHLGYWSYGIYESF